jgi:NAD(P) transhydrogenase subunit alpha
VIRVGVPKETAPGERRVALTPDAAGRLVKAGLAVTVESGAGAPAGFVDDAYRAAGAEVASDAGAAWGADIVAKVQKPGSAEVARCTAGAAMVGTFQASADPELLRQLAARRITAFSLELLPRITRAQSMDVLSSQATVAGYKAVLLAAQASGRFFPMLVTAAGTLSPARVVVLGAGVAGLQAIATARRLGAVVAAFDVRAAVKEQVESLGATFLAMDVGEQAEGAGGYAKQLSADAHARELEFLARQVKDADVVITTALIPGKPAPRLVTAAAVEGMKPGSVIVDLASESGGNCELTQSGSEIVHHGVTILGPVNLPSAMPLHASQMYGRNVATFLQHVVRDGALTVDLQDEITRATCVTHGGSVLFGAKS